MTFFSEYIKSIITVGMCAFLSEGVCSHLCKSKITSKSLKFITNLCVFTIAVSPVFSLFTDMKVQQFDFYKKSETSAFDSTFLNLTANEMEKALQGQILQQTGIFARQVSIKIECNDENICVEKVSVTIDEESDRQKVQEYITNVFTAETEITVNTNEQN